MSVRVLESVVLITLLSFVLKWGVALFPYSGEGKPPMYGDYEAQRHWQEVTVNLNIADWYVNSTDNDLLYWGLDYPPLTAYHSYVIGLVARGINSSYVELNKSRGYESYDHKLFMRYSVFVADILIYIPAVLFYLMLANSNIISSKIENSLAFVGLILSPGLMLIDYGHFQYNNVSLGLFVAAVAAVVFDLDCVGSFLFSLALNYKQMELYHALPFFFYLLGKCFKEDSYSKTLVRLFSIGGTVILTFLVIWSPFLQSFDVFAQVVNRVFPINRGLFEDKVASVWCGLSVLIKFKEILSNSTMAVVCLAATMLAALPSCINLFMHPTEDRFKYSLVNISFVFFLFSYHVHEKSILLVLVPACLLYGKEPFMVTWFTIIANLSMLPLLDKDGLFIPYVSLTIMTYFLYNLILSYCQLKQHKVGDEFNKYSKEINAIFTISLLSATILSFMLKCVAAPQRYPDLYPVLISIFSCGHFIFFMLYFYIRQFNLPLKQLQLKTKVKRK